MIDITLNDDASEALETLAKQLLDLTPIWTEVGEGLLNSHMDRIKRGEQPDGHPFAPRSATTLARYDKRGWRYGNPLNLTGVMRDDSLHYSVYANALEFGSSSAQSAVMHFGAKKGAFGTMANGLPIPWGDIPARPFIGLSDEDQDAIVRAVGEWLTAEA